ncbi:MAG: polysaccharide deacetylase family protein [Nitrospiria bacterium]
MGTLTALTQTPARTTGLSLKGLVRRLLAGAYYRSSLPRMAHRGKVLILAYHRVLSDDAISHWVQPGMFVTQPVFAEQMKYLRENYDMISLNELLELWDQDRFNGSKRYCVVTFDDGWRDNYLQAYPVLKAEKIPAAIFLPVSYIGTNRWFWTDRLAYALNIALSDPDRTSKFLQVQMDDRFVKEPSLFGALPRDRKAAGGWIDSVIERIKRFPEELINRMIDRLSVLFGVKVPDERVFLTWEEIEEMSRDGISFGSHSSSHRILTGLSPEEVSREMKESLQVLNERGLNSIKVFCYPNGNLNEKIKGLAREAGYRAALGTGFGMEEKRPEDLFSLRRIGVHQDISFTAPLFAFHLSGLRRRRPG